MQDDHRGTFFLAAGNGAESYDSVPKADGGSLYSGGYAWLWHNSPERGPKGRAFQPWFDNLLTTLSQIEGQPQPEADPPLAEICLEGQPRQPRRVGSSNVWAWHHLLSYASAASRLALLARQLRFMVQGEC
jgi:hypothetical protein